MIERSGTRHGLCLAGCFVAFLGLSALAPGIALDVRAAYALAFACVAGEIVFIARVSVVPRGVWLLASVAAAGLVLVACRAREVSTPGAAAVMLALLTAPTLLGASLGARIEKPGHLLAVAIISGLSDLWSVYDPQGLSARLAERAAAQPDKLTLFALPWPMIGTDRIEPIIGAGDVLFTALYFAAFERHGLMLGRATWAVGLAYLAGLAAIMVSERPVPLLPLLAFAVLCSDARARVLPREERRTVLVVLVVLCAVLAARFLR